MIMSALMGTGCQLVILATVVILYAIMGDLYAERATILTATIFLYALTSGVAGYTSARYYARYGGAFHWGWIREECDTDSATRQGVGTKCSLDRQCMARLCCFDRWICQQCCHLLLEFTRNCIQYCGM